MLLPTLFFLLALLVQPVCILYTKTLMQHAAAEGARVYATSERTTSVRSFILRRLKAVPDAAIFHTGGERGWEVELSRLGGGRVEVCVRGHVRPLPLMGVSSALWGIRDAEGIVLEARVEEKTAPAWYER